MTDSPASDRWFRYGLAGATYVFVASTYFSIAVNSIALGLMAVCWGGRMLMRRQWDVRRTPLDAFFLAYVVAELLSLAFSLNPPQALVYSKRLLLIGIVYFCASQIGEELSTRKVMAVLLGAAVVVSVIGVMKLLFGKHDEVFRLGIFQFYMTTSELMMIAGLLLVPFVIHPATPARVRIVAVLALVPVLISLYATVTRGAYLAMVVGVLFIALIRYKRLLIPLVLLVILIVAFAPPYVHERIASIVDPHHPDNVSRLMMWKAGLRIFMDHPFVGVGDIDLGNLMRLYADPGYPGLWGHLHNIFLQFLVTLGLVGAVVVVALFVKIAVVEWRVYKSVREEWFDGSVVLGALAVFVGFQVNGLTEWSFGDQEVVILFWITVGLSLAISRRHPSPVKEIKER